MAFAVAACYVSSLSAFAADMTGISGETVSVADLAMIGDGYDAGMSGMTFEIELPRLAANRLPGTSLDAAETKPKT